MRKLLELVLLPLAQAVFKKYRPLTIAVTGTVGKTSAKNAIAAALGKGRNVRAAEKNNNTEIGAAVTIIGGRSPGRSVAGWLAVLLKALKLLIVHNPHYPSVLVLEYAAERPGDVSRLCQLFPPQIGVLTAIGATHARTLGGIEGVVEEKSNLLRALPKDGWLIANADDPRVMAVLKITAAKVVTYGLAENAHIRAFEPHPSIRRDSERGLFVDGTAFKIELAGKTIPIFLPGVLGTPPVYAALAASAVLFALDENQLALVDGLKNVKQEKGRLRVIPGIKFSTIIDDTYNASTVSMLAALAALQSVPIDEGERRLAVLGDMREMGALAEGEHQKVG
ncbi:hypothetical protein EPN90_00715, partial [Patescibacteria group bacterium]